MSQPFDRASSALRYGALLFVQMLPATLVAPAIRPLFVLQHGGQELAMHAFMSVNMAGAILVAPWLGALADRRGLGRLVVAALCAIDGLLLTAIVAGLEVQWVLTLRFLEGAAHVSATSLLMARAANTARRTGQGRIMGVAGAAIMLAIASGSAIGGLLVSSDPRLPFFVGAGLSLAVATAVAAGALPRGTGGPRLAVRVGVLLRHARVLRWPIAAAFVARFTVGTLIVTLPLFVHRAHGMSDAQVGGLFALLTFPFALATYPLGRLCDRMPAAAILATGAACYGTCLLLLADVPTAALPVVMGVAGLASAALFAPVLTYAAPLGPRGGRATAMGLVNAAGCFGMVLGPAAA
ncbi:MAG: MFS transporter, partial [Myxococcota bacterium]